MNPKTIDSYIHAAFARAERVVRSAVSKVVWTIPDLQIKVGTDDDGHRSLNMSIGRVPVKPATMKEVGEWFSSFHNEGDAPVQSVTSRNASRRGDA